MSCIFLKGPTDKFLTSTVEYQNHHQNIKKKKKSATHSKVTPSWGKCSQVPQFLLLLPSPWKKQLGRAGRREVLIHVAERMA